MLWPPFGGQRGVCAYNTRRRQEILEALRRRMKYFPAITTAEDVLAWSPPRAVSGS